MRLQTLDFRLQTSDFRQWILGGLRQCGLKPAVTWNLPIIAKVPWRRASEGVQRLNPTGIRPEGPEQESPVREPWDMGVRKISPARATQSVPPLQGWSFALRRFSRAHALGFPVGPFQGPPDGAAAEQLQQESDSGGCDMLVLGFCQVSPHRWTPSSARSPDRPLRLIPNQHPMRHITPESTPTVRADGRGPMRFPGAMFLAHEIECAVDCGKGLRRRAGAITCRPTRVENGRLWYVGACGGDRRAPARSLTG